MANKQPFSVNTSVQPVAPQVSRSPVAPQVTLAPPLAAPQLIVLNTAPQSREFKVRAAKITGIIQIICAVLSATFGIVSLVYDLNNHGNDYIAMIAWPIWGAVCFYVVAGIIGVLTGSKNTCVIVTYMVMSILAAVSGGGQGVIESLGADDASYDWQYGYQAVLVATHSVAAVVGFIEMTVAIVAAAFCCHGVCWRTASQQVMVQYAATSASQMQTVPPPYAPPQYYEPMH